MYKNDTKGLSCIFSPLDVLVLFTYIVSVNIVQIKPFHSNASKYGWSVAGDHVAV